MMWSVCYSSVIVPVTEQIFFTSAIAMVFGLPLTLAPYVFVIVTACTFQFAGPVFFGFLKTFQTFALGVRFRGL